MTAIRASAVRVRGEPGTPRARKRGSAQRMMRHGERTEASLNGLQLVKQDNCENKMNNNCNVL